MRSRADLAALLLAAALVALGLVAEREALRRSTIPLELDHVVAGKRIGFEKHPGRDDVHFLDLAGRTEVVRLVVDEVVWIAVDVGDTLTKAEGARVLDAAGRRLALEPSRQAKRLRIALALAVLPSLIALSLGAGRSQLSA